MVGCRSSAVITLKITQNISINESELEFKFIRSPGPGGQNVNKVATAVLLRFNVFNSSSLSDEVKERIGFMLASRITLDGDLIVKATQYRTQERNKQDAIHRLLETLRRAVFVPKKRKATRPTLASKERRLSKKKLNSRSKVLRRVRINRED